MKIYKLNTFYPWWTCSFKSQLPIKHIETIVEELKETFGDLWEELEFKNFEWKEESELWLIGTKHIIPTYLKIMKGATPYYYYLYDSNEIVAEKEDGIVYKGKYLLDSYMTKYHHKLTYLLNVNPYVKFNHKYCDRYKYNSTDKVWYLDFVEQKYLSSYVQCNSEKVRKKAYSTTENKLYGNNFPNIAKPTSITLLNYKDNSKTWKINNFKTLIETPSNTGRYRWIVCKSSAKVSVSTDSKTIQSTHTTQSILLIPIWNDDILSAINDIKVTSAQTGALSPLGDNFIGFWESDLPYSFVYGMYKTDETNIKFLYATNETNSGDKKNIPFFEIPLNYYKKWILINFSEYAQGFAGILTRMINNSDKWNPDTEPALLAPQNYEEDYNNGVGTIKNDFSYFIFKWDDQTLANYQTYLQNGTIPTNDTGFMNMYVAFGFDNALNIAYDFGENTNTKLASYDNTEVITSSVSIQNQLIGSASANYYASNVNSGYTSVENRISEQKQAWTDYALNTAKNVANTIPNGLGEILFQTGKFARRVFNSAVDIAKGAVDTALSQQRANRSLMNQYNNIYSSPSSIVGNPYIKGIIPNDNELFKTYSLELHPYDKAKVFGDILEFGRIYDTIDKIKAFDNNEIMNILDINPYTTYYRLLSIVLENDNTIFNTPKDNDEFFNWLANPHQIFNTIVPVNCLNYQAENYVDNIEHTKYPKVKINISTLITNIPNKLPAHIDLMVETLKKANPDAPEDVWNDIISVDLAYNHCILKAKQDSTKYTGQVVITKSIIYNGKCYLGDITHYFFDWSIFTGDRFIAFPDGAMYQKEQFNLNVEFNTKITRKYAPKLIDYAFLSDCVSFNKTLILPTDSDIIILSNFMYNCKSYNSQLIVYSSKIYDNFMNNCTGLMTYPYFLSNISLHIGKNCLMNCTKLGSVFIDKMFRDTITRLEVDENFGFNSGIGHHKKAPFNFPIINSGGFKSKGFLVQTNVDLNRDLYINTKDIHPDNYMLSPSESDASPAMTGKLTQREIYGTGTYLDEWKNMFPNRTTTTFTMKRHWNNSNEESN